MSDLRTEQRGHGQSPRCLTHTVRILENEISRKDIGYTEKTTPLTFLDNQLNMWESGGKTVVRSNQYSPVDVCIHELVVKQDQSNCLKKFPLTMRTSSEADLPILVAVVDCIDNLYETFSV
jgi:hypothetical protein